jgi:hypothetical protein
MQGSGVRGTLPAHATRRGAARHARAAHARAAVGAGPGGSAQGRRRSGRGAATHCRCGIPGRCWKFPRPQWASCRCAGPSFVRVRVETWTRVASSGFSGKERTLCVKSARCASLLKHGAALPASAGLKRPAPSAAQLVAPDALSMRARGLGGRGLAAAYKQEVYVEVLSRLPRPFHAIHS